MEQAGLPPFLHQSAAASGSARILQAGGDLQVTEVHHHPSGMESIVLVERVLPTAEAVAEVFVGRDAEVDSVLGVLDPAHDQSGTVVVSAVAGLAGVGKTALARTGAAEAVARGWFPGGAVFVDLNGYAADPSQRLLPRQTFGPLLHALTGGGTADTVAPGQLAVRYHQLLDDLAARERCVLLVLDNASATDQLADLLPRSRRHRVVVTSRHTLAVRGSRSLDLRTLTGASSLALVTRRLEQLSAWDSRIHDDPEGARRLCELCGHLPLALHIVTALLAGSPGLAPGELADELAGAHSRLDLLDDGERAVRAAFDLSYRRLSYDQARLFRILPVNPGPHFGIESAARLLGVLTHQARPLLRELARAHMIEHVGAGAWRQHDLIRDYAIELLGAHGDDQRQPAEALLLHYAVRAEDFGGALRASHRDGFPSDESVRDALAWFHQEQANLRAAIAMGVTFGDAEAALRVLAALAELHRHRGQWAEFVDVCRRMLAVARDDADTSPWALLSRAWDLGALLRARGHDAVAGRLLDIDGEALRVAVGARDQMRIETLMRYALQAARDALSCLEGREQLQGLPLLHEICRVAAATGLDNPVVTEAVRECLRLCRAHGDDRMEALTHMVKARYWLSRDRIVAALDRLESAVEPLERSADVDAPDWVDTCRLLAAGAVEAAELALAIAYRLKRPADHLRRAADLSATVWRQLRDTSGAAAALSYFAEAHHRAGYYEEAIRRYDEAVGQYESLGERLQLGRTLVNLAAARTKLGRHEQSVAPLERAAAVFATEPDADAEWRTLDMLARALGRLGRPAEAVPAAERAVRRATAADLEEGRVTATVTLALMLRKARHPQKSRAAVRDVLRIMEKAADPDAHRASYHRLRGLGLAE
ncbi:ATP-binding protein [Streptomyces longispororuber]|uniref:ATP-binding protein n=1 Tax=Streptomyces longispororuber TaxID=68230 RepID=UPI00210A8D93|nr:tetratricopeptide repeat protein [Streptomyces longispororuber]MCQ4208748.1 tetratricopeptide repeat protein [Streptomyces longispororuber]